MFLNTSKDVPVKSIDLSYSNVPSNVPWNH